MVSIVTLTTDFGTQDAFVGTMKGVILSRCPEAQLVDLTHEVPPQAIRVGALRLASAVPYFPEGSVHLAVVDPGVGGTRRPVAVEAGGQRFVGPDNGVLSLAASRSIPGWRAVELSSPEQRLVPVSNTFHGRDIFAPVAAHLATGMDLAAVGAPVDPHTLVLLPEPVCVVTDRNVEVEVLTIDRFGNVQLALPADQMPWQSGDVVVVTATARRTVRLGATFGDVPTGELVAYVDSAGFLALAVNGGRAVDLLGLAAGDLVHVRR